MPGKPLSKGVKKAGNSEMATKADGKKRKKSRKQSFKRVLKEVHPDTAMSSKAMSFMDSFMNDVLVRISTEANHLAQLGFNLSSTDGQENPVPKSFVTAVQSRALLSCSVQVLFAALMVVDASESRWGLARGAVCGKFLTERGASEGPDRVPETM
ncbi:hypothetical protein M513_09865 [Trichuris suis]|uniref:Core Histone H2A/H2B/H3 domain-containing protein n=2 Tax=Trichuris suis TaxID=68888 RepID=A0A085LWG7_9BILA|nr:hypothetical protein M513_09865 [Trichuris suis]